MSKKRIDETMTQARQAKAKKAREQAETEATVELLVTKDGIEKIEPETPDARPTVAEWMAAEDGAQAPSADEVPTEAVTRTEQRERAASEKAKATNIDRAIAREAKRVAKAQAKAEKKAAREALKTEKGDLMTFAFRLTQDERDTIHKAAGPGKASKFVRQVAIAAARGDVDAVQRLIDARA